MRSAMHNETNKRLTDVRCSLHTKSTASWSIIEDQRLNGFRIKAVRLHGKLRGLEGQMAFLVFPIDHALNGIARNEGGTCNQSFLLSSSSATTIKEKDVKHP
jgi:hypothetical protein